MNTGACPNRRCDEFIDFYSNNAFPTKCIRCREEITEKHHQQFKEIMQATRAHLDSLKMSDVACKKAHQFYSFIRLFYLYKIQFQHFIIIGGSSFYKF